MDLQKLFYSFLCFIASILCYKYIKWKKKKQKERWGRLNGMDFYALVQGWGVIIFAVMFGIYYLLQAIHYI